MGRAEIRELVKQAQAAEVSGDLPRAVDLLSRAGELHLSDGETGRGVALLRHCFRLRPDRVDLRERADLAEAEREALPASIPDQTRRGLAVPPRGPTPADPEVECWCSFCCRPRAEVGPMVAGPAGAFVCAACVGTAADLLAVGLARPAAIAPSEVQSEASGAGDGFIEAAVRLSLSLGWTLTELRGLTPEELARAEAEVHLLGQPVRKPQKKAGAKVTRPPRK